MTVPMLETLSYRLFTRLPTGTCDAFESFCPESRTTSASVLDRSPGMGHRRTGRRCSGLGTPRIMRHGNVEWLNGLW